MADDEEVIEPIPSAFPEPIINAFATKEEWFQFDPVLRDGQLGIEYDPTTLATKVKAGWAGKPYSQLPYVGNLGNDNKPKLLGAEPESVLETIPAPIEGGQILVSMGVSSLKWNAPDSGVYAEQGMFRPRVLRQTRGLPPGPPSSLLEGQLAVNFNGHGSSDKRPALYIGGSDGLPVVLVSEQDLLINLHPRAYTAEGGATVAEAVNNASVPIDLVESELLVVSWGPWVYLFGGYPGRYGGLTYSGEGGPGNPVQVTDFIYVSVNYQAATMDEIINGSAPEKSVNANSSLQSALYQMILSAGSATLPAVPKANQIVLTKADGRIDLSLLPSVLLGLSYGGTVNPSVGKEYPVNPATNSLYIVTDMAAPYEFATGDLAGKTCFNSDQMIWNGLKWDFIGYNDLTALLRSDGSTAMTGSLNLGGNDVEEVHTINVTDAAFIAAKASEGSTAKGLILDAGTF